MMAAKKKGRRKAPPPIDLNEELRKREYVGQREGEELAKCLNQADLDDPLVQLVEDMHAFQAGQVWKAQEIVQAINDAIGRLRIGAAESHGFDPQEGGFTWKQMPTSDPEHVRQSFAWTLAITLHKLNLLGRMRRCAKPDCQKWFFRGPAHPDVPLRGMPVGNHDQGPKVQETPRTVHENTPGEEILKLN